MHEVAHAMRQDDLRAVRVSPADETLGINGRIAPARPALTVSVGFARSVSLSHRTSARSAVRTVCANVERATLATSAATATGRSRRMNRSKKTMKTNTHRAMRSPARVTPMSGTESSSIRWSTANE